MNLLLTKAKLALRIVTTDFDAEIIDLILSAIQDLRLSGVVNVDTTDPLMTRAILTYVKMNFGEIDRYAYDRLRDSYWLQKSELQMATGYTDWGDIDPQPEPEPEPGEDDNG